MNKPVDYESTQVYGEFIPIELGGHICKIMKVEETQSKTSKDMIIISLDTAPQDKQPNYYSEQYKADDRENKKWGCRIWQLVLDNDGKTNRGLKTFITAVENSNKGFQVQWGDNFSSCFKGKLVGGVFGREQYEYNGEIKWSTKCVQFRSIDKVLEADVPKDKLLKGTNLDVNISAENDFSELDDDGDLPF